MRRTSRPRPLAPASTTYSSRVPRSTSLSVATQAPPDLLLTSTSRCSAQTLSAPPTLVVGHSAQIQSSVLVAVCTTPCRDDAVAQRGYANCPKRGCSISQCCPKAGAGTRLYAPAVAMPALAQQIVPSSLAVSTPHSGPLEQRPRGTVLPLSALLRGRACDVVVLVADLKAELETWIDAHPHDYGGLVLLGELNLRIGLTGSARELLYRASLLEPPSWEAMQRTGLLLRRAEAHQASEYVRTPGAPPPLWVRRSVRALADRARRFARRG